MVQLSQWLFIHHAFLFRSIENTIYSFFFNNKNIPFYRDKALLCIHKTVFFDENYKNISISEKNIFFLKFYFLWKKNYKFNKMMIDSKSTSIRINKSLKSIFDYAWLKVFYFCNNFLFSFFLNNMKMLVLDSSYKNFFFFVSYNFNKKDVINNFDFFFPKVKNFSKWVWLYYFNKFCSRKRISAFFVSDAVLINRNSTFIESMKLPIIAFMTHKKERLIDYSFFFHIKGDDYYYLMSSFFLNYTFFLSLNYKLNCFKYLYIKNFSYIVKNISEKGLFLQ